MLTQHVLDGEPHRLRRFLGHDAADGGLLPRGVREGHRELDFSARAVADDHLQREGARAVGVDLLEAVRHRVGKGQRGVAEAVGLRLGGGLPI